MTCLSDSFQRPIDYLRISVTDRCNLRCIYCMPPEGVCPMAHSEILTYEEIYTVVQAAAELGIKKVRLTGGEPLVRLGLPQLVRMIARIQAIDDLTLTTNGILLADYAIELKKAGLKRVNVHLDTFRPERFRAMSRGNSDLSRVLKGIEVARSMGLNPVKINMVVMTGVNDDEILNFAAKTINEAWHVRFIELMPSAGASTTAAQFISAAEIKKCLETLGELEPCHPSVGNGPAKYFRFQNARGTVGFITPVSEHFCFKCNRLRLTSDGKLRPCLMSDEEVDLKGPLRNGISLEGLKKLIREAVANKPLHHHLAEDYTAKERPFYRVGG